MKQMSRRRFVTAGAAAMAFQAQVLRAKEQPEKEVEATEDLMREHGVLRRALLVYTVAGIRLRGRDADVPVEALAQTAQLFRQFGEEYHERKLEEQHVFPALVRASGRFAGMTDALKAQHERGREITGYLIAVTRSGKLARADAAPLARTLDEFVLMYRRHAAMEDTVVFPAWKESIPDNDYHEASERFEEIEHRMLGADGYEEVVKRIAGIEEAFGIADLDALTAPRPPSPAS